MQTALSKSGTDSDTQSCAYDCRQIQSHQSHDTNRRTIIVSGNANTASSALLTAGHFAEVDELRMRLGRVTGGEVGMLVALV